MWEAKFGSDPLVKSQTLQQVICTDNLPKLDMFSRIFVNFE